MINWRRVFSKKFLTSFIYDLKINHKIINLPKHNVKINLPSPILKDDLLLAMFLNQRTKL